MKKLMAILMLLVFVLSIVPAVFAASDGTDKSGSSDVEMDDSGSSDDDLDDTKTETKTSDGETEIKEKSEVKKRLHNGELREEIREERRERIKNAMEGIRETRKTLVKTREKFLEAKEEHKENVEKLHKLRDEAKECSAESDECKTKKNGLRNGVMKHLEKTVSVIERSIERLFEKVEKADLSDEEKDNILANLEQLKADLQVQKEELISKAETATAQEVKESIKELKETWKEVRKEQKKALSLYTHNKLGKVVDKHTGLVRSMDVRIENAEKQGLDTTVLAEIRDRFAAHTADLDAQLVESKETCSGDEVEDCRKTQKVIIDSMKQGSKDLLREFTSEWKKLHGEDVLEEAEDKVKELDTPEKSDEVEE